MLGTMLEAAAGMADLSRGIIAIGAGIVVIGAAFGLGKIGQSAMEAIARQPQAAGDVRSSMIIIGAFLEGVSLFAAIVCFMALPK